MKSFLKLNNILLIVCVCLLVACQVNGPGANVSARSVGFSKQMWESFTQNQRNKYGSIYRVNYGYQKSRLARSRSKYNLQGGKVAVAIEGGTARMWPYLFSRSFKPRKIQINPNTCSNVLLQASDTEDTEISTDFLICYIDDMLYLDPSRKDSKYPLGSVIVPVNNLLKQGILFKPFSTFGYASLRGSSIAIAFSNSSFNRENMLHLSRTQVKSSYKKQIEKEKSRKKIFKT